MSLCYRNWIGAIFAISLSYHSFAQSNPQLPTIIPPSPVAQSFQRYGEIPVDYSTGVPNIDIPIFVVEGGKLSVPISISYHASGIKVEDIPSEVGLGWTLNAGGIVSRTTMALPDEATPGTQTYTTAAQLLNAAQNVGVGYSSACACYPAITSFETFLTTGFGSQDPITDRFFYKLPDGTSGVFRYNNVGGNLVTMPYRLLKIEKIANPSTNRIEKLKITDQNGTLYMFESIYNSWPYYYSEWYLRKMISADGVDVIDFNYVTETVNQSIQSASHALVTTSDDKTDDCSPISPPFYDTNLSTSYSPVTTFNTPVLSSIVSSKSIVTFEYASREDFSILKRLTKINVAAAESPTQIIKTVQFNNNFYFGTLAENKRLKLESVVMGPVNPTPDQEQRYSFSYESQVLPGYPNKMSIPKYNEDFWGYYNGSNANTLIEADFITNTNYLSPSYAGDRDPDPVGTYSRACMLKEIQYPTGGKTTFSFERCQAKMVYQYKSNPDGIVGGFRVGRMTNYNADNTVASIRSYEYQLPRAKTITPEYFRFYTYQKRNQEYISPEGWKMYCFINTTIETLLSNPLLPLEVAPGMPVMYQRVIEFNGTPTNHAGKTVYEYGEPYSPSDYLYHPDHPFQYEQPQAYQSYQYDKGNYVPQLISKTDYVYNGVTYYPLIREVSQYTPSFSTAFTTGINLTRVKTYNNVDTPAKWDGSGTVQDYINSIVAIDTRAYQEASLLTNQKLYTFDPSDSSKYLIISTDYSYNERNLAVREKITSSSANEMLRTTYKYPFDFLPTVVYDTLVRRWVLSPVIEQTEYNDTKGMLLVRTKTNYKDWGGKIVEPESIEVQKGAAQTDERINFLSYSVKGNVTSLQKNEDVVTSYIWGYNGKLPVAEIRGVDYSTSSALVNLTLLDNAAQYTDQQVRTELDKIRVGLTAQGKVFSLTTYTYKPLVGMTSKTESNGVTTYFEYDTSGRLQVIKDQQGNIVKTYEYHYQK